MKRQLTILLLAVVAVLGTQAQTAREELKANKYLAGSNYLDYDRQLPTEKLTPAPKGYVPFYMSHYGRHGSRWLISEDSYTSVTKPLQRARKASKLTAKGEEVLTLLEEFVGRPHPDYPVLEGQYSGAQLRLGDLTTVGERQHHGIGRRMVQNFPEIFKTKGVAIDARSTTVNRCILSMMAECEELAAANPTARIHNDVSDGLQYYLNQRRSGLVKAMGRKGREMRRDPDAMPQADRLMQVLFNDQKWVKDTLNPRSLMNNLFEVTTNMQSHDDAPDLYGLFTDDEIYGLWKMRNTGWYVDYGAAPLTEGVMPFSQRNLLRNIIETADTVTQTQATLRFGHEVCVLPLACLLELGDCGASVSNLDELDKVWRNYRIFPMACNIQLVFYRSKKAGDVLVKALLNEREMKLPVKTDNHPYYKWSELRQYYLDKLAGYDAKEAAANLPEPVEEKYAKYYHNLPVNISPVKRPVIPGNELNLKRVGGVGDGVTLNTEAFSKAISKLTKQGGGRLTVPAGVWLTGPIALKDNIELHLQKNAIVVFAPDKKLYLDKNPNAKRVVACIRASKRKNIAITGKGVLDGSGEYWRYAKRGKLSDVEWKALHSTVGGVDKDGGKLFYPWDAKVSDNNIAETPEQQERKRNDLIRLTNCENVLIEGVTVQNSPRFHIHPLNCKNVIIDGVSVRCPWNAQNGDGIDITDCHQVLLVRSTIDVGDDGICFKSDPPKADMVSGNEDIVVEDNLVRHAHGGFVMGSNTSSGMRRMVVRNNTFTETDTGLRFKSGIGRGGKTEQIFISDIVMTNIAHEAIVFQCDYADKAPGETADLYTQKDYLKQFTEEQFQWTPNFQDIHIKDITCRGAQTAIKATGLQGLDCVHDIDIQNATFVYQQNDQLIDAATAKLKLTDVKFVKE